MKTAVSKRVKVKASGRRSVVLAFVIEIEPKPKRRTRNVAALPKTKGGKA